MNTLDIAYWTCMLLGGGYTLVTLMLGGFGHGHGGDGAHAGDAGHAGHVDAGAHAGHALHADAGAHAGHTVHADGGTHTAHADHGLHMPHFHGPHAHGHHGGGHAQGEEPAARIHLLSYLNPMAVAGFLLGFGGTGVLMRSQGASPLASLAGACASGYGLWLAAYLVVTRIFAVAGGTSHFLRDDLVGMAASVTAPIAPGRPGMVCCTVAGSRQSVRAIVDEACGDIPVGASVRIVRIEAGTARVVRSEDILTARHSTS